MLHTAKINSISHDTLADVCYVYHRLKETDKEERGKILHPYPVRETVYGFFDRKAPPAWREIVRPSTRTRWTRHRCTGQTWDRHANARIQNSDLVQFSE